MFKIILVLMLMPLVSHAVIATRPNTYVAGDKILASEANDDFDTIYTAFNGQIEGVNIIDGSLVTADYASASVTRPKQEARGEQISLDINLLAVLGPNDVVATNSQVTLVGSGRPVLMGLMDSGTGSGCFVKHIDDGDSSGTGTVKIQRGGTDQATYRIGNGEDLPCSVISNFETGALGSGTNVWRIVLQTSDSADQIQISAAFFYIFEL